ncbi:MAG TPA: prepilin-type N-terminal cleavage/methylation domain-containing protein, partial [Candidatus Borkfalkia faecipullorum]|nr:prepilin-type N-terminal cleavage/methylation domain-containing protein [Candidatus Borkfalkia faecipullorum]HIX07640.1 prepilin-type N-terminal cleavage/methylation domain-containing protein [Candidatus Borkfalkia faecipullorum]
MAKRLKRAFTIVELVIVIAVIAILAAVLIPTFTTLID